MLNRLNSTVTTIEYRRNVVSIPTMIFCLIIIYSFTSHLIMNTFSGRVYTLGIVFLTGIYFFTGHVLKERSNLTYVFVFLAVLVAAFGYIRSRRNDAFIDFVVLLCGYLMVRFHGIDGNRYYRALKVIAFFGMFFSVGVLLQAFLPGVHRIIVRVFPSNFANAILSGTEDSIRGNRGFTTNSGHAAGFICAGILSIVAQYSVLKSRKTLIPLALLFLGLFFTGKRGPFVFVLLTIMLFYLIPYRGSKKVKRYWRLFLVLLLMVLLYYGFRDLLARVPLMNEIIRTIEGISVGEDVSSSRIALYTWALRIFREHPLFGIGWGMYRTTVVGNVTFRKALDTHNIYLQLLAETGIIGFAFFAVLFILMWIKIKNAFVESLKIDIPAEWRVALSFSFLYQTFFLLYGLSGNTLYDQHYQILYMVSCAILAAYQYVSSRFLRNVL